MILSKPYAERRVIHVVESGTERCVINVIESGTLVAGTAMGPLSSIGEVLGVSAFVQLGRAVGTLLHGGDKLRSFTGVLSVPLDEALGELMFPPAHPLLDHAYAGHPLVRERYIPYAAFHRFLFEEKVNELMTLLASLGATRVKVSCSRGYRSGGGISIGVAKGAEVGAGVKTNVGHTQEASFEEHFRPQGKPKLPVNLIWYPNEPSWQAVARRRLDFGTSRFKARLSYEDSFGIDGNLKAGLDHLGVKVGGNYNEFESTEWDFEGEFSQ